MQLSYLCRIACVAFCSTGLLQVVFECVAWIVSVRLTRHRSRLNARFTERLLFLLALSCRLAPTLLVLGLLLPAYMRGEEINSAEHVGAPCILAAALVLVWFFYNGTRLLLAMANMQRCFEMCREIAKSKDGLPILLYPGERTLLAIAGVFSPRIIVSRSLLDSSRFPAAALDVAFAHESAHANHHDNLKLLLLRIFPHITLGTSAHPSIEQRWRFFAELAADHEGAAGRPEQSVLLAEMLVAMARANRHPLPSLHLALLSRQEDLQARVERLLAPLSAVADGTTTGLWDPRGTMLTVRTFLPSILLLGAIAYTCIHLGHPLAEIMLRFS
jgi:hypothetical protein